MARTQVLSIHDLAGYKSTETDDKRSPWAQLEQIGIRWRDCGWGPGFEMDGSAILRLCREAKQREDGYLASTIARFTGAVADVFEEARRRWVGPFEDWAKHAVELEERFMAMSRYVNKMADRLDEIEDLVKDAIRARQAEDMETLIKKIDADKLSQ